MQFMSFCIQNDILVHKGVNMAKVIIRIILTIVIAVSIMQLLSFGTKLIAAFAEEHAKKTPIPVQQITLPAETKQYLPERIVIEKVEIDLPVVYAPLVNGTWDVTPKAANYAEGTSLINDKEGNVGIFGHARADAFLRIKDIVPGDIITLTWVSGKAVYKVVAVDTVSPDNVEVFYPVSHPVLTLTTCDGRFDEKRFMVRAELIEIVSPGLTTAEK
jgi:LPXTG-site transpeptidase (sortase) family protein